MHPAAFHCVYNSESIISLEFSSYKSFFTQHVKMAKANRNLIVNHKGEEHEKQIVSDSMYSQNDHNNKFWILRSNVLVGSTFYKYLGGVVVKHYYIVKNDY